SGIQGNYYALKEQQFFVFDIYDTVEGKYLDPETRQGFVARLGLEHVPISAHPDMNVHALIPAILDVAQGKSQLVDKEREGLVFKSANDHFRFKAISNRFLLKEKS
ncbi:MAG: hypothetical protein LBB55_01295, partial [Zoogloeaceae bacterium]|nr:hypothetical protein [Zoogloeaceae bacterium]